MFSAPENVFGSIEGVESLFHVLRPLIVFGGTEGVGSHYHVLRARTNFHRYRGRRVPFSCCALTDLILAVSSASGPVFVFCAPRLVFGGFEGVVSRFHVLHSRNRFRRCGVRRVAFYVLRARTLLLPYQGRRFPFSCFALPDSISTVRSASGRILCFACPESSSAVPRASCPVFMFCAPRLVFDGTDGVGSRFRR
jgi:hypothetical protein